MVRDQPENLLAFGHFHPVFSRENAGFSAQTQLIPKLDADPARIAQCHLDKLARARASKQSHARSKWSSNIMITLRLLRARLFRRLLFTRPPLILQGYLGILFIAALAGGATAGPATQPSDGDPVRVLVLPFHETASSNQAWVGKALQQDLVVDMTRATRAQIEGPSAAAPAQDSAAAMDAARQAGASLVVYGQFQSVAGQMRITGQVLSAPSGQAIGSVSATGPINDLFPLEDAVSMQVMRALPAGLLTVPPPPDSTASSPTTAPPAISPQASSAKYYSYTYPDYSSGPPSQYPSGYIDSPYYLGYPYYWYSIPYYGPDIFFYSGWDHYHHHHFHHSGAADHWHATALHEFGGTGHFQPRELTHAPAARSFGTAHGGGGGLRGSGHR
jgi:TolB-like protein